MSTRVERALGLHHGVRRWLINLGLLLAATLAFATLKSLVVGIRLGLGDYPPLLLPYDWLLTTFLLVPGAIIYLALLELLPARWPYGQRRLFALLLSPVVAGRLWMLYAGAPLEVWELSFVLPLIYSLVVRLRPTLS
jgi:hypothetical protein